MRFMRVFALGLVALCGCASSSPYVRYQNSESEMELAFLPAFDEAGLKYEVETFQERPDDKFVRLSFEDEGVPAYTIFIDTQSSAAGGGERAVRVDLRPWLFTSPEGMDATLRVLNEANAAYWPGDLFVGKDGSIRGEWVVNTEPGTGVHPLMVIDMVRRFASMWVETYAKLQKCEACQIHGEDDAAGDKQRPDDRATL